VPYALEVVLRAVRLSLHWNGSVSRGLIVLTLGPILSGAKRRALKIDGSRAATGKSV